MAACTLPGNAAPVIKIGLVAPFEGLGRPLGYAVLPAVQLALDEANAGGYLGPYKVALVAYNDDLDPATVVRQVAALAQHDDLLAALGPWSAATAEQAAPAFAGVGLPALVAAPLAAPAAGVGSLCPSYDVLAVEMLAQARRVWAATPAVQGPANALRAALEGRYVVSDTHALVAAGIPGAAVVLSSGDTSAVADDLWRWRAGNWRGVLIGGPDLGRPWLAGLAGQAGEGSWALACAPGGSQETGGMSAAFARDYAARAGFAPGVDAWLAYQGTRRLLAALSEDIRLHGHPRRDGVAAALAASAQPAATVWLQLSEGVLALR